MLPLALFAGGAPHPTHGAARVLGRLAFAPQRESPGGKPPGLTQIDPTPAGQYLAIDRIVPAEVQADFDQMDVLPDFGVKGFAEKKRQPEQW